MHVTEPLQLTGSRVVAGGTTILDGVDLRVCTGEAVALLGANGSGKSTLVRSSLGQMPLAAGSAQLFGASPHTESARVPWPRIGYVPQRLSANSGVPATALEVVSTGLLGARRWWLSRTDRAKAMDAMVRLDVDDLAHRPFGQLSGGQAQRVVIARALVRDPDLLLLDEPLAGVDLLTQAAFADVLTDMHRQGRTIVMVLHELGPFADLIDRAVVLRAGAVVHDGPLPRDHGHGPNGAHDHLHDDHALPEPAPLQRSLP